MSNKNRIRLIGITGFILLIILFVIYFSYDNNKEYFTDLSYSEVMEKIENKEDFVLCVSSTQCSHCAAYKPKLKEVAEEYKLDIYYTDIDLYSDKEQEDFEEEYLIDGTPITLFFMDGKEQSVMTRLDGDVSKDKIITKLKEYDFIEK